MSVYSGYSAHTRFTHAPVETAQARRARVRDEIAESLRRTFVDFVVCTPVNPVHGESSEELAEVASKALWLNYLTSVHRAVNDLDENGEELPPYYWWLHQEKAAWDPLLPHSKEPRPRAPVGGEGEEEEEEGAAPPWTPVLVSKLREFPTPLHISVLGVEETRRFLKGIDEEEEEEDGGDEAGGGSGPKVAAADQRQAVVRVRGSFSYLASLWADAIVGSVSMATWERQMNVKIDEHSPPWLPAGAHRGETKPISHWRTKEWDKRLLTAGAALAATVVRHFIEGDRPSATIVPLDWHFLLDRFHDRGCHVLLAYVGEVVRTEQRAYTAVQRSKYLTTAVYPDKIHWAVGGDRRLSWFKYSTPRVGGHIQVDLGTIPGSGEGADASPSPLRPTPSSPVLKYATSFPVHPMCHGNYMWQWHSAKFRDYSKCGHADMPCTVLGETSYGAICVTHGHAQSPERGLAFWLTTAPQTRVRSVRAEDLPALTNVHDGDEEGEEGEEEGGAARRGWRTYFVPRFSVPAEASWLTDPSELARDLSYFQTLHFAAKMAELTAVTTEGIARYRPQEGPFLAEAPRVASCAESMLRGLTLPAEFTESLFAILDRLLASVVVLREDLVVRLRWTETNKLRELRAALLRDSQTPPSPPAPARAPVAAGAGAMEQGRGDDDGASVMGQTEVPSGWKQGV